MPRTPIPHRLAAALVLLAAACAAPDTADRDGTTADTAGATVATAPAGTTGTADTVATVACAGDGAVVTARRAGAVRLGMTAAALHDACAARDTSLTLGEGLMERAVATEVGEAGVVALLGAGDTVERIMVVEPGLATERGVEVGSDLGTLRARYAGVCMLVGEGRIVVASNELAGVSFQTSADFATYSRSGTDAPPDSARVTGILVHGAGQVCAGG